MNTALTTDSGVRTEPAPPRDETSDERPSSPAETVRTLRIGLLGCGCVGSAVARQVLAERESIAARTGLDLRLTRILVNRPRPRRHIPEELQTSRLDDVLETNPDIVVEVLGGFEPAATHVRRALESGASVVTANKTVIARRGEDLRAVARAHNTRLAYEATVCAAIPILAAVRQYRGQRIRSMQGVVNGSVNYILTRMREAGVSLEDALAEARERGLIEPDPAADLSGRDSAEKLAILAHEATGRPVDLQQVVREGIERITAEDVLVAKRLGFSIKLVAEFLAAESGAHLRVGPTLVPRRHRLAGVEYEANGVAIDAEGAGGIFLEGAGAGPAPTAAVILGDVLRLASGLDRGAAHAPPGSPPPLRIAPAGLPPRRHLVRIDTPQRRPPGEIFNAFRNAAVSIKECDVRPGSVYVLTHPVDTRRIHETIEQLGSPASTIVPQMAPADGGARRRSVDARGVSDAVHAEAQRRTA